MKEIIKIGTRSSALAVWQAEYVSNLLTSYGHKNEIVYIKSEGDLNLVSPLYKMNIQGIFTRTLDTALINHQIDIAVHSLKDVPTQLAEGLKLVAVSERESWKDALVYKSADFNPDEAGKAIIATGSLRRKAQWLSRYPQHSIEPIRGNNTTRLQKLMQESRWDGSLFALAGIKRINLDVPHFKVLDWMLPAPAQGALGVVCREDDAETIQSCEALNHKPTELCTSIERDFMRAMNAGCSMPISALAEIKDNKVNFRCGVYSIDGSQKIELSKDFDLNNIENAGSLVANELLAQGGSEILKSINTNR